MCIELPIVCDVFSAYAEATNDPAHRVNEQHVMDPYICNFSRLINQPSQVVRNNLQGLHFPNPNPAIDSF